MRCLRGNRLCISHTSPPLPALRDRSTAIPSTSTTLEDIQFYIRYSRNLILSFVVVLFVVVVVHLVILVSELR